MAFTKKNISVAAVACLLALIGTTANASFDSQNTTIRYIRRTTEIKIGTAGNLHRALLFGRPVKPTSNEEPHAPENPLASVKAHEESVPHSLRDEGAPHTPHEEGHKPPDSSTHKEGEHSDGVKKEEEHRDGVKKEGEHKGEHTEGEKKEGERHMDNGVSSPSTSAMDPSSIMMTGMMASESMSSMHAGAGAEGGAGGAAGGGEAASKTAAAEAAAGGQDTASKKESGAENKESGTDDKQDKTHKKKDTTEHKECKSTKRRLANGKTEETVECDHYTVFMQRWMPLSKYTEPESVCISCITATEASDWNKHLKIVGLRPHLKKNEKSKPPKVKKLSVAAREVIDKKTWIALRNHQNLYDEEWKQYGVLTGLKPVAYVEELNRLQKEHKTPLILNVDGEKKPVVKLENLENAFEKACLVCARINGKQYFKGVRYCHVVKGGGHHAGKEVSFKHCGSCPSKTACTQHNIHIPLLTVE